MINFVLTNNGITTVFFFQDIYQILLVLLQPFRLLPKLARLLELSSKYKIEREKSVLFTL